ncbi:MAG: LamG domain-containing protein [Planctomycetes bacterium]|nr:LamG domain-containing protein [Planctomycetota bacterium]
MVIVPYFGPSTLKLENPPFDASKPTVIYFGGGDCVNGAAGQPWGGGPAWTNAANIIDFPSGYTPDSGTVPRSYYKYGDMVLTHLSAAAPDYQQAIQTIGWSTGVDPALDVGLRLNEIYRDARYAANRVTQIDGGCRMIDAASIGGMGGAWAMQLESYRRFLDSAVDGEQCWIDFCYGVMGYPSEPIPPSSVLWVRSGLDHPQVRDWYRNSLTNSDINQFNGGVVGGAYWSVVGPGKNLQLASAPGTYYFAWSGGAQTGTMGFFNQSEYPGRLPEPVTLLESHDPSVAEDDPNGVILTCKESQNAVGYQLLSGSDPYNIAHYHVVADGNSPPAIPVTKLPSSDTWWTVRARDAYGSTIYADPIRVDLPVGVIAYWKLDEASGVAAADSVGTNHGTLMGNPIWQPTGGKVKGALQFDGIDEYVSTPFVRDPSQGPFSIFAWVKGRAPGRVILSQKGGANWLLTAPDGTLMTELMAPGRSGKPLRTPAVITDDAWHRVGFVWDGSNRSLYVDGIEVARDTQASLAASAGGLYLGVGSTLAPGTFWSGLIDDVRIYDRAVQP